MTSPEVVAELKRIAAENGGILLPERVVAEAADASSPLHSKFTWDDTEAAHNYRLWEARQLIRVCVTYLDGNKDKPPMRVFVSLTADRNEGGYRVTSDVMSDSEQRKQLLTDALEELEAFQRKYEALKELADVFAAAKRARKRAA